MNWVFSHLPLLIFGFVLFSVVRAVMRAAQLSAEHKAGTNETEEQKRMREIQERIRKKIAERRGGAAPAAETQRTPDPPPILRPASVGPTDPFGGPARRIYREVERRVAAPVPPAPTDEAILERQQQLSDQMWALEEARAMAARRAAQAVEGNVATARATAAAVHRAGWLADLRDPQSLRRAFVLREVLGAPVALR